MLAFQIPSKYESAVQIFNVRIKFYRNLGWALIVSFMLRIHNFYKGETKAYNETHTENEKLDETFGFSLSLTLDQKLDKKSILQTLYSHKKELKGFGIEVFQRKKLYN